MGSISALKLHQVFRNVEMVLAIEVLTAAQALDYRRPLKPGKGVEEAHQFVRRAIPHAERDHYFEQDLSNSRELVRNPGLIEAAEEAVGALG